ncbi:Uncharacterised protein [Mycobacteroides abscessus subsp. abscessus]|nr:Uncharacterised protein [Mycobacteroides abscessus subsp. abscessus]
MQHVALGKQRHPRADNQPLGGRCCVREHHRQVADQRQPRAKLGIDRVRGIDGEVRMIIEEQPFKAALLDGAREHIRGHVSVGRCGGNTESGHDLNEPPTRPRNSGQRAARSGYGVQHRSTRLKEASHGDHGSAQRRRSATFPAEATSDDDRDRGGHRRRPVRRVRRDHPSCRARRVSHLRDHRRAHRPGDADARRDGRRQPLHRLLRRLQPPRARRLGGILRGLAVLVLLGDRRRIRSGGRGQAHPGLAPTRAALAGRIAFDAGNDGHQPVLGALLR